MIFPTNKLFSGALGFSVLMVSTSHTVTAAPGDLANIPLFTKTSTPPNVFFEVDDSGSMDWEILTKRHWQDCSYSTGSTCNLITNGLYRGPTTGNFANFEYLFDNGDDVYGNTCSNSNRQTLELCSATAQTRDWRVKAAALNIMYYNPETTYEPWQKGDGTTLDAAVFTAAKSDPQPTATGYTETRDLAGFVYHVWEDTHGFSGTEPDGGDTAASKTAGSNGWVDWWDEHDFITVNASSISIQRVTYAGNTENTGTAVTLSGSGAHPELNGRTVAEEQQNIANWYQYGRRRSFAAKSAIAAVITEKPDFYYGLNFINNSNFPITSGTSSFIEVEALSATAAHNKALLTSLFSLNWPAQNTPLRTGLERVGQYFDNVDGRPDPIVDECQNHFTVLMTDGYWNGSSAAETPSATIADADGDGQSITVADVARYYFINDLNTTLPNTDTNGDGTLDFIQNMRTFTVAFGVIGLLTDTDGDGIPEDTGGNPLTPSSAEWGDAFINNSPQKIDDLWHAAFNSDSTFISAETPEEVTRGLSDALQQVEDSLGSNSAVAFNTTTLTGDSLVYLAQFKNSNNKWSGDLLAFELDSEFGNVAESPTWSAADVLEAESNPVENRNIFTYNRALATPSGVPFRWDSLSDDQQADLRINPDGSVSADADDLKAKARLDFIRGDRSNDDDGATGTTDFVFRNRSKLFGDIVHSNPVFVGQPLLFWPATGDFPSAAGTTYDEFKENTVRDAIIYVGSNDGMLHGFNATDGSEKFAFIPNSVYSSDSASSGLHFLTDPSYAHRYYVDMPVAISDVYIDTGSTDSWHTILIGGGRTGSRGLFALDITNTAAGHFDETNAAATVLWEFDYTDDPDLGFTHSKPTIGLMENGRWAAIFGNGYNSTGDGQAKLFIVFLEGGLDGEWTLGTDYLKISTEAGTIVSNNCLNASSDCNGLSSPVAADLNGNGAIDRVYAGDLFGNLWAFDLDHPSNTGRWKIAGGTRANPDPLFTATHHETPGGGGQPVPVGTPPRQAITNKPTIIFTPEGGANDVLLFFGTGQYLVDADVTNNDVQTFYGVRDNGSDNLTAADLIQQTFLTDTFVDSEGTDRTDQIRVISSNPVDYAGGSSGWFINLPDSGERVIVDSDIRGDILFFNTWIPKDNACDPGGSGWLMSVDQATGGQPTSVVFDFDGDGDVDEDDFALSGGTNYVPVAEQFNAGLPASSSFLSNKQYTPGTDSLNDEGEELEPIHERTVADLSDVQTGRLSWQELRK